ncbi:ATP-binding protein [Candidatus Woesearchaeota archaeon]|nr:ATP-binding protein [Candidatus Woesearchaeota archaeon]
MLPPPPSESAFGEFELGTVTYDEKPVCMFGMRERELLRHIGIFGITGTGKSNVVFKLIDELLRHKRNVFVFDWKKQYRDYLSIRPEADVLIFGVGNPNIPCFQFNPLIPPPGLDPSQYLEHVCQIVASAYYCGEGVISLLRKAISLLYHDYGVFEGKAEKYPTFRDVLEIVQNTEKSGGRSKDWQESTIRSLEAICHGGIDKIVNVQQPTLQLSELLKHNVILELGDLGQSQKKFIIQSLLFYIYYYTMNRGVRERFLNAIIIEEAHHILQEHSKTSAEPITDIILKEIREFSTGVVIVDQNPSLISVPALANNYLTIGMYTKHGSDIAALSRAMFLDEDQKQCLGKLDTGYGIVKLAGRIFSPFLVRFPLMKIKKGSVSDAQIAEHMAKRSYYSNPEAIRSYSGETEVIPVIPKTGKEDDCKINIVGELLKDMEKHPFNGIASRTKRLGISPRKSEEIINNLTNEGIIRKVDIKERHGRRCLLEFEKGIRDELIKRGAKLNHIDEVKDGGLVHRFWNHKIAEINEAEGYKVELEHKVAGDGFVDQVVRIANDIVAVEIETGHSAPIETIRRDLSLGFDRVVCIATTDDAWESIRNKLLETGLIKNDRVFLVCANMYMPDMLL